MLRLSSWDLIRWCICKLRPMPAWLLCRERGLLLLPTLCPWFLSADSRVFNLQCKHTCTVEGHYFIWPLKNS